MTTTPLPRRAFLKRLAIGCAALAAAPALSAFAAHIPTDDERFATALKTGRVVGGRYVLNWRHRLRDEVIILDAHITLNRFGTIFGDGSYRVVIDGCRIEALTERSWDALRNLNYSHITYNYFDFS